MIIASISTIPGRLNSLIKVLESLLIQTTLPSFLYISVSDFYPRSNKYYPKEDLEQLNLYLTTYPIPNKIVSYEKDIGPTVKLITPLMDSSESQRDDSLRSEPLRGDFIFTLDDDTPIYERTIETLLQAYNKHKDSVYGLSGARQERFIHAEYLPENYDYFEVDILGGYRGVLYPKHLIFKEDFYSWVQMFIDDSKKHNLIAMHDDHIFSYYFKYKKIPRRVSNSPFTKEFKYNPINNTDGIFKDDNTQNSFKILKETLYNKDLGWVVDNPF